jgi:hypothetical protein
VPEILQLPLVSITAKPLGRSGSLLQLLATPPVLLNSKVTKLSLIKLLTGKSTSNGLPITSALILSILVFLNLSSKPLNAATSLPVVICSSVPSTKSVLSKSMILLRLLSSLVSVVAVNLIFQVV